MSLAYICRLCLSKSNLVWILAKRNKKLAHAIRVTTGIKIRVGDTSQNVCKSCCQLAMKFLQFKNRCQKNNKYLKAQLEKNAQGNKQPSSITKLVATTSLNKGNNQPQAVKTPYNIHPSVTQISKTYPQMKLPSLCLKSHLLPYVSMQMNEVENYFKKRNSSISKYLQTASIKPLPKAVTSQVSTKIKLNNTEASLLTKSNQKNKSHLIKDSRSKNVKTNCSCLTDIVSNSREGVKVKNKSLNKNKSEGRKSVIENKKKMNKECSKAKLLKTGEKKYRRSKGVLKNVSEKWKGDILKFIKDKADNTIEQNKVSQIKQSKENPVLMESLQLLPKATAYPLETNDDPLYHITSLPLYECSICNTTTDTIKALRKHESIHKQCELCKKRFNTIENKIYHTENKCIYRQTVNIPATNLAEIEGIMEIYHTNDEDENFSILKIENESGVINTINSLSTESDLSEYLYQKST